ncbi:VOC family protein [Streptantibioticus silvisoli]|jgi:hypothetical protein|uniref:VOC family protein n=1 Tax=Streptantibioticus silvisoli TaxID=2705255 RepID=A0ABT6VVZ2_9ACTN|nr:VOC family protein [Streptantibioticus silvisoli]MDI5962194.1 VOC family protein [Streptantibioticus silvisoli]
MIIRTYARVFTHDMDATLSCLRELHGHPEELRVDFAELEIATIGDLCVVAGPEEALERYRPTVGPLIVDDLDAARETARRFGAEFTVPSFDSPTGRGFYARHPDGVEMEYVQWNAETLARVRRAAH